MSGGEFGGQSGEPYPKILLDSDSASRELRGYFSDSGYDVRTTYDFGIGGNEDEAVPTDIQKHFAKVDEAKKIRQEKVPQEAEA